MDQGQRAWPPAAQPVYETLHKHAANPRNRKKKREKMEKSRARPTLKGATQPIQLRDITSHDATRKTALAE
jgi:hypothetical protein